MDRPSTLPVPPFSRSRSVSQSSNHSNPEGSQEHATTAPQEPLLSSTDTPEQSAQSSIPRIHTVTTVGDREHHGRSSEALERLEKTWYLEAFFLLCSTACAVLIVTFLAVHNNTNIDSWHFYLPISAVISTLGTVFKSTLLMAVSAALAQGKWTWFQKRSSPLSTFQAIDAGSHDTLESFRLLWHIRGQHLVSAGALVIALGFMIEPFLQYAISDQGRLIDLDPSNINSTNATIGRSKRLDGGTQCVSGFNGTYLVDTTPDFAIAASLYDGLNAAIRNSSQNVSFTCTSGNCTWPEYVSIAIRSTCFDISDHLKKTNPEASSSATAPTANKPTPSSLSATINPTESSESVTAMNNALYTTAPLSAFSDVSTVNSMVAPLQSIATLATADASADVSQGSDEPEASTYAVVATAEPEASTYEAPSSAPVQSSATKGLEKRASPSVHPLSTRSSQSSAKWTDWTLDYLNLTLSNTNPNWREADQFVVLRAAVEADPKLTINFKTSQTLLAAFTIIRADDKHTLGSADWDAANASAMECGLELTLNVYNSSVVNNVLLEQIVASVSQKRPKSWLPTPGIIQNVTIDPGTEEANSIYHERFLWRDDYALDPAALQREDVGNFSITQRTLLSTVDFLTSLIRQNNDNATVKGVLQGNGSVLYTYGSPILQPLFNKKNTTATFGIIAKSMSDAIRSIGIEKLSGTTKQWVRFYQVRWAFLALPLSLITIGIIFFVLSIVEAHNAHVPNWKANSIAAMVHGPDELLRRHLRTQNYDHSLTVAGETVVRLTWTPEGHHLTAVDQPDPDISRPTTPVRDVEEHEMNVIEVPTTPRTPGSAVTLVDPQVVREPKPEEIRSVSPMFTGPDWSEVSIDSPSTPSGSRESL